MQGNSTDPQGMLTLNASANNGVGTIQIPASTVGAQTFSLIFVPFGRNSQAFTITTFSRDASGAINVTFQFPSKGSFAGYFDMDLQTPTGPSQYYRAGPNPFDPDLSYHAPMLPASTISGGLNGTTGSATGSGTVTLTSATAQLNLNGATASHTFAVSWCGDLQHCVNLGVLMTDGQGNATGTFSMNGTGVGGSFVLSDSAGAEFISGFRVP